MYSPLLRRMLILCLIATALMIADRSTTWLQPLRMGADYVLRPLNWIGNIPRNIQQWSDLNLASKEQLVDDNKRLRQERLIYRGRLQRMSELAAENLRLLQLLNASELLIDSVLVTQVIGVSPTPQRHTLTIDRGADDGAYVGQPLLDSEGLMGQLVTVFDSHSVALLITDGSHALPVKVLRNGVRSIAEGTADFNRLNLRYVSPTADIKLGDQLLSSGLGGRFPAGYPVGIVSGIEQKPGSVFMDIAVDPSALLDRSTHLLLVFTSDPNNRDGLD